MDQLQVEKREGGTEAWNNDKLISSLIKAGMDSKEAENITDSIQSWASQNSPNGIISSTVIRDKIISTLETSHPEIADSYKAYKMA
jgi:2-phosphoglycerate kinase